MAGYFWWRRRFLHEHTEYKWMSYADAISYLKWDGNKVALRELNKRLNKKI